MNLKPESGHRRGSLLIPLIVLIAVIGGIVLVFALHLDGFFRFDIMARVERSMRATFPKFCSNPGDHMLIFPDSISGAPPYWDVSCDPNPTSWKERFVTVNSDTCAVSKAFASSLEWEQVYGALLGNTSKLAACP